MFPANGDFLSFGPTPAAAAPSGDAYVTFLDVSAGPHGQFFVHQFDPAGAHLGSSVIVDMTFTGAEPLNYFGLDPLGELLFTRSTAGSSGVLGDYATKWPAGGTGSKTVGKEYSDISGWTVRFGDAGGDDAGHWLAQYDLTIQNPALCTTNNCGFDFGNGIETGSRLLRWDAAGTYLGSIPSPGVWRLDHTGKLHVVKGFTGSTDIGCGSISGGTGPSTLLATLDIDGNCLANKAFAAPAPAAFTLAGDGSLLLAFVHTGSIDLGSGPLPDLGGQNLTIAKLDLAGTVLMTRTFGGSGATFSSVSLDAAPSGVIALGSAFSGTVDLGAGPIGSGGNLFLAAFDPGGALRWDKVVTVSDPKVLRMTPAGCNMVVVTNGSSVDLGAGPVVGPPMMLGMSDLGVVALAL